MGSKSNVQALDEDPNPSQGQRGRARQGLTRAVERQIQEPRGSVASRLELRPEIEGIGN